MRHCFDEKTTEKINIIDEFLKTISAEDLKSLVESDLIVGKLKGTRTSQPMLSQIIDFHDMLTSENMRLRTEIDLLRNDMGKLIKCLSRPQFDSQSSGDFGYLRCRYNIY